MLKRNQIDLTDKWLRWKLLVGHTSSQPSFRLIENSGLQYQTARTRRLSNSNFGIPRSILEVTNQLNKKP